MAINAIYTNNGSTMTGITSGSVISLGSIVNRSGCSVNLNGSNIVIGSIGTYYVSGTFSVDPSADDTVTIQAYKDGVPLQGAKATWASESLTTIPIVFMVKHSCCMSSSNIYFVITTATATTTVTISNANVTVTKL